MKMRTLGLGALVTCSLTLAACGQAADNSANSGGGDSANTGAVTITDVKGREVTFDEQPERIIMGEGRGLFATSILNKDNPIDNVVAMGSDLTSAAPSFKEKLEEAVPAVKDLPEIGNMAKGDVTVENLLSFEPDALVMTADHYDAVSTTGMLDKLDDAGIKYVVTDFRQHPLTNTTTSVEILGELFGKQEEAEKFSKDWTETVDRVKERVKDLKDEDRPTGFVWRAPGQKDCCGTMSDAGLGEYFTAAGGHNIGEDILDTEFGDVTAEKIIAENPEVIIATGGSWKPKKEKKQAIPHVELGYAAEEAPAREQLVNLMEPNGFDELDAYKEDNLYAVWHQFYDSPMNFLALEQFAKWLHPDLFKDVDVQKHWETAHEEYMPFPASGTFFVSQHGDQKS